MTTRRELLESAGHACGAAVLVATGAAADVQRPGAAEGPQRFLLIGLVGSENPTRANFPFVWAAALRDLGHDVRIELAGDATVLMRTAVADSVTPVGWPPFKEALARVIDHKSEFSFDSAARLPVGWSNRISRERTPSSPIRPRQRKPWPGPRRFSSCEGEYSRQLEWPSRWPTASTRAISITLSRKRLDRWRLAE